jgi:hypothetical protein
MARLKALFVGKKEIDPAILEQMEEVMISSDVGVKTTQAILERLREKLAKNELANSDAVWAALRLEATRILEVGGSGPRSVRDAKHKPVVVLMVGVNGVGKKTTIGKLATKWSADGRNLRGFVRSKGLLRRKNLGPRRLWRRLELPALGLGPGKSFPRFLSGERLLPGREGIKDRHHDGDDQNGNEDEGEVVHRRASL